VLDRLAKDGVLFERAVAAAPTTLPAHVSLMTGRNPMGHGVRNNGVPLENDVPTLAAAFRAAGYRTGAFVSAFVLDERFGLARGFDTYDDDLDPPPGRASDALERRGDRTVAAASAWLASTGPGAASGQSATAPLPSPFFLWVHLYDPHDPYEASAANVSAASPYDAEITFTDAAVGSLLETIARRGQTQNTVVAVIGDHGESLGEHGEATHGMFVYESAMRVPALLAWPGHLPAGARVSSLVRAIDLAPTLLELTGRASLAGAVGVSLVPLVRGAGEKPATAYGETYFPQLFMNWAPLRSLREGQWKLIEAPTLELYDLAADPGETVNLAAREPDRAGRMRRALRAQVAAETRAIEASGPDRETMRKLAALGYVGGGGTAVTDDPLSRPDPKAMIGVFNQLRAANTALDLGRLDEAARVAADTLTTDPGNAFAMLILGKAERAQGRYRQAAGHFRGYLEQVPLSADAHHWLAICQLQLGDFEAALAEVELALAIDTRFAEARTLRGDLLVAAGRVEEGLHYLRAAVNVNPERPAAHIALGRTLIRLGQSAGGEEEFRYSLDLAERFASAGRESQAALVYDQLLAEPTVPAAVRDRARARRGGAPR
jgi:choline-sulfatase